MTWDGEEKGGRKEGGGERVARLQVQPVPVVAADGNEAVLHHQAPVCVPLLAKREGKEGEESLDAPPGNGRGERTGQEPRG